MQRRHFIAAATALPFGARAEAWPAKPVHLIVPFPPGGTTDVVSRLVATEVSKTIGQPVVIDNRPGAGTVIGVDAAAKAPADGYTLVTVANSFCINQTLVKNLPYDGQRDFRPVALMGLSEHVLAASPETDIRNIARLFVQAKRQPGKLTYASFGNGTSAHLAGEMLKAALGIDLTHVPYKGQAPALNDLLGGQVSLMFGNWPELRAHVRSGKLNALGMATAKRSVYAPDIATLTEQGVAVVSNSWSGVLVRSAVPDAVVQRLNVEINAALQAATVAHAFSEGGISALPGPPERFAAFIASETETYARVIRRANITLE